MSNNEQMTVREWNEYTVMAVANKFNNWIRKGDQYSYSLPTNRAASGQHFMRLAFEAYAEGDELLGDLHASCAERYFIEADMLRGTFIPSPIFSK